MRAWNICAGTRDLIQHSAKKHMILSTHVGVAMIREGDSIYFVFICISSYLPIKHSFEYLQLLMANIDRVIEIK